MATSRAPKLPHEPPPPAPVAIEDDGTDEITPTDLSSDDAVFLQRVATFLFQIHNYAARVRTLGYDDEEHEIGRRLYETASGRNRPLSHWIAEGAVAGEPALFSAEQMRLLQEIDAFENTWFPRMRGIIRRAIPAERLEVFEAAFFNNLSQQPLGPGVLDSVSTLLTRFEELAKNGEPGAKEAHRLGVKRGLTPEKIAAVRALVKSARDALPAKVVSTHVSPAELAKAQAAQRTALAELRLWYNDWASTLRTVFGTRAQIRLGLTSLKRSPAEPKDPQPDPPEPTPVK